MTLITLEGIDGSGKSTLCNRLRETFTGDPESIPLPDAANRSAVFTSEPTDSWYGEHVAASIADSDADPLAELFLYTADHADHIQRVVRPALADRDVVFSDRYSDSRIAYQTATLERSDYRIDDPFTYIRRIHEPITIIPDLTLYLDLDAETAAERAAGTNKFERVDFLADVRANYKRLFAEEPRRIVPIDATRSLDEIETAALNAIAELWND